MRTIFFGTPELATPALRMLAADPALRPLAVFTQPQARRSRRGGAEPSPVGQAALELGLELHEVATVNEGPALARITELRPDVIVVVAFGQFLKRAVLNLPPLGCLNFHPSALPRFRGAAPVQRAVLQGVVDSGLTVMRLVRKMDAGPILAQQPWRLDPELDAEQLLAQAGDLGAPMLRDVLYALPGLPAREQSDADATFAPPLAKQDGVLDFRQPATQVHNRVRAVQPWPGAECQLQAPQGDRRVLVHRSALAQGNGAPGTVLAVDKTGITIACGQGALTLTLVQLEGKPRVAARDAANGLRLKAGDRFRVDEARASGSQET